jgi:hypothetical protein
MVELIIIGVLIFGLSVIVLDLDEPLDAFILFLLVLCFVLLGIGMEIVSTKGSIKEKLIKLDALETKIINNKPEFVLKDSTYIEFWDMINEN